MAKIYKMKAGLKTLSREKWKAFIVTKKRFLIIEFTPKYWLRFLLSGKHEASILRLFIFYIIGIIIYLITL